MTESEFYAYQEASKVSALAVELLDAYGTIEIQNVITAQAIQEKGWQYWTDYPKVSEFNFFNVGDVNGVPLPVLSSEGAGLAAYGFALLISGASDYAGFVDAIRSGNVQGAIDALDASPWASPPYGQAIQDMYNTIVSHVTAPAVVATPEVEDQYVVSVTPGETLWSIAEKYGTTFQELAKINGIRNPAYIQVGQKIKIK